MNINRIPSQISKFMADWVSSSTQLLYSPTRFLPPLGSRLQGAARTSMVRTQIGFAISSVSVALIVFQLVNWRQPADVQWNSLQESVPITTLFVGAWIVWSMAVAGVLKLLGGVQPPEINILFGIRLLSIVYMMAMLVGTLAFLTLLDKWLAFAWTELVLSSLAYTIYTPLAFISANNIRGWKVLVFMTTFVLISGSRVFVDLLIVNGHSPPEMALLGELPSPTGPHRLLPPPAQIDTFQSRSELEGIAASCRRLLTQVPREQFPGEWADDSEALGDTLKKLARAEEAEGLANTSARRDEAGTAYRQAISVSSPEFRPYNWIRLHWKLGDVFYEQAEKSGIEPLKEALAAYNDALKPCTPSALTMKRDCSEIQDRVGDMLMALGRREASEAWVEQAIIAYDEALIGESNADIKVKLGDAILALDSRSIRPEQLEKAIAAYGEALTSWTSPWASPVGKARIIGNQGIALMRLADRRNDRAMSETALSQIIAAYSTMRERDGRPGVNPIARETEAKAYEAHLSEARNLVARLSQPQAGGAVRPGRAAFNL
jgi:tetratricopeptide (TPR) repeat protein